jgi:hypothetical protein
MKNISIFLFVFLVAVIKAQNISDYKYVLISQESGDFKEDKSYGLPALLEKTLKSKKYLVLPQTKSEWPQDALLNPCKIMNAEILDDKSMFRNKVILQFKDCSNKVVFAEKGSSVIKEFEPGYQDALKLVMIKIPLSSPSPEVDKLAEAKSEQITNTPQQSAPREVSTPTSVALKYTNGKTTLQKIKIDDTQFILVDGNSSVPFATFKSTAKKDVFRVKLSSGESTIGYYENGNIVIEMPKSNGEFSNEIFTAN